VKGAAIVIFSAAALLAACDEENMRDQPRVDPFDADPLSPYGAAARSWPPGTVARESTPFEADDLGQMAPRPPVTMEFVRLGQDRFNTFCAPCHGRSGYGEGMIPRHTFPKPPSLHDPEQRTLSDEDVYRIITQGLGKMPPYADQVAPEERWAVVAYVRALQRSQHDGVEDAPEWDGSANTGEMP
jgi:mono/diheme cytochrome c family protein